MLLWEGEKEVVLFQSIGVKNLLYQWKTLSHSSIKSNMYLFKHFFTEINQTAYQSFFKPSMVWAG
jgi:hypothetical protein